MNEVEKLYSLAGVEGEILRGCYDYYSSKGIDIWTVANCEDTDCKNCKYNKFIKYTPPFTAEKQLELIKLLQRKNGYKFSFSSTNDNSEYLFFAHKDNTPVYELIVAGDKCYEEALAGFINTLWQDLTEEERTQIKEILK